MAEDPVDDVEVQEPVAAEDETPPAPPVSPLDALKAHHAASLGPVNHNEISALITAFEQHIAGFFRRESEPFHETEPEPRKSGDGADRLLA